MTQLIIQMTIEVNEDDCEQDAMDRAMIAVEKGGFDVIDNEIVI